MSTDRGVRVQVQALRGFAPCTRVHVHTAPATRAIEEARGGERP